MQVLFYSVLLLGVMGFVAGLGLSIAAKKFEVKEDPRVEKINEALPGVNCGMCGYAGCAAYAKAVVQKGEKTDLCIPGKKSGISEKIKEILKEPG